MPLQVELVSVEQRVWAGEAQMVIARTLSGDLGIMAGHTPLLAALADGEVTIRPVGGGEPVVAYAGNGFISVEHDRVTIVADRAGLGSRTQS